MYRKTMRSLNLEKKQVSFALCTKLHHTKDKV